MDGISAAASIWALVEATGTVVKYLKAVKSAREDQISLGRELSILYALLCKLAFLSPSPGDPDPATTAITGVDNATFAEYKEVLSSLHDKIRPHKTSLSTSLAWPFREKDVKDMLQKVERLKTAIALNLGVQTLYDTKSLVLRTLPLTMSRQISDVARADAKRFYERLENDQDQSRLDNALQWISNTDYRAQKSSICAQAGKESGEWFRNSTEFQQWMNADDKRILLAPGVPGAGKTTMSACVIDHLEERIAASNRVDNLAYVFFDYKSVYDQGIAKIFGSLLQHLVHNNRQLAEPLLMLHETHAEKQTYPSADEILMAMQTAIADQTNVFIIIDALDELSTAKRLRWKFIDTLHRLHRENKQVRILMTSRLGPVPDILKKFGETPQLEIKASDEDIERYVAGRFPEFNAQLDSTFENMVKKAIIVAANGMFLWVRFIVDRFAEAHNKRQIRRLIEEIQSKSSENPTDTYKEIYEDTMRRINLQSRPDKELAEKTLRWIITAGRILSAKEVLCALSVEPGQKDYDPENLCSIELVLSVCGGLVVVDPDRQTMRLVHFTAQEYLESRLENNLTENHYELAEVCLTYLCFDLFRTSLDTQGRKTIHCSGEFDADIHPWAARKHKLIYPSSRDSNARMGFSYSVTDENLMASEVDPDLHQNADGFRLYDYAANFWPYHARLCEREVSHLALPLLMSSELVMRAFVGAKSLYQPWDYLAMQQLTAGEFKVHTTGLHLASALGRADLCNKLIERKREMPNFTPNDPDGGGRTALMWAAHHGHVEIVKLLLPLLPNSSNSYHYDARGDTAMHYAARQGHTSVVALLIQNTLRYPPYWEFFWRENHFQETALVQAALGGHRDIVKAFKSTEASSSFHYSVHSEIIFGIWPVHRAAQRLPVGTMKLLVEDCEVSLDQQDPKGYSPFATAVDWGNKEVVEYFFEEQKVWLDKNPEQVILAAHLAAANSYRMAILQCIVKGANFVVSTRNPKLNNNSLLTTAVDAGNMKAAIFIAEMLGT